MKVETPGYVTRGAQYLDLFYPDWHNQIDLKELNMMDGCRCIMGQLSGVEDINRWDREYHYARERGWDIFGAFSAPDHYWRREIRQRQHVKEVVPA